MLVGIELLSKIPPENRREFIRSFKVLPHYDGCKQNCSFSRLFEDVGNLSSFLWVEYWADKKAMDAYLQSDRFKTILGAVEALGEIIYCNTINVNNIEN